jgi:hypothetical protein
VAIGNNGYNNKLIDYIRKNKIDLFVSINLCPHDFKKSLKKTRFFSYMETPLSTNFEHGQSISYKKQQIDLKLDFNKVLFLY